MDRPNKTVLKQEEKKKAKKADRTLGRQISNYS